MAHDLLIKNGSIVDGTGSKPYIGDVAVSGDTITEVGSVSGAATQTIDADGNLITPGFVDLHTHFDAQAGWDPMLTPVSWHGVTTALFGNCGVTFAPCKPADREFLAGMMETVEDIPKNAILTGLPWDWESYGEYLDSIEKLDPAINITGLVGHCASRFYVMGERSITDDATEDEIKQIAQLVGQAVKDGAVGFSTNRLPGHVLPDGRSIPGTFAQTPELVAIAEQVGKHGGILQAVLNYGKLDHEMDLLKQSLSAAKTKVLFSAPYTPSNNGGVSRYDDIIADMRADGLDITGLTLPRSGGFLSSVKTAMAPFAGKSWEKFRRSSFDERMAMLRDATAREQLIADAKETPNVFERTKNCFYLGDSDHPQYVKDESQSISAISKERGIHPAELWIATALETNGEGFFHMRFFNTDLEKLQPFLKEDWVLPGIGDAGAHVSQIMDSGWTSFMLANWVRDNELFKIEDAIKKLTSDQARVIGFDDRGTLAAGKKADINVLDLEQIRERQPELVHDFPDSAPRLIQKAKGYKATVVNGDVILRDDEHTGTRAGRVLRNANSAN